MRIVRCACQRDDFDKFEFDRLFNNGAVRAFGLEIRDADRVAELGLKIVRGPGIERDFALFERRGRLTVDRLKTGVGAVGRKIDRRDGRIRNLAIAVGQRIGQVRKRRPGAEWCEDFFRLRERFRFEQHSVTLEQKVAVAGVGNRKAVVGERRVRAQLCNLRVRVQRRCKRR